MVIGIVNAMDEMANILLSPELNDTIAAITSPTKISTSAAPTTIRNSFSMFDNDVFWIWGMISGFVLMLGIVALWMKYTKMYRFKTFYSSVKKPVVDAEAVNDRRSPQNGKKEACSDVVPPPTSQPTKNSEFSHLSENSLRQKVLVKLLFPE